MVEFISSVLLDWWHWEAEMRIQIQSYRFERQISSVLSSLSKFEYYIFHGIVTFKKRSVLELKFSRQVSCYCDIVIFVGWVHEAWWLHMSRAWRNLSALVSEINILYDSETIWTPIQSFKALKSIIYHLSEEVNRRWFGWQSSMKRTNCELQIFSFPGLHEPFEHYFQNLRK